MFDEFKKIKVDKESDKKRGLQIMKMAEVQAPLKDFVGAAETFAVCSWAC